MTTVLIIKNKVIPQGLYGGSPPCIFLSGGDSRLQPAGMTTFLLSHPEQTKVILNKQKSSPTNKSHPELDSGSTPISKLLSGRDAEINSA